MAFLRRTTTATEKVVLTFDPAVMRENSEADLTAYTKLGGEIALKIPADALTVTIRPLSLDDRFRVEDNRPLPSA